MIVNKNKGILFWITGLSGSGKTTLAIKIKKKIEKRFGKTMIVSGDDLRNLFNFKTYTRTSRLKLGYKYSNFAKFVTDQNINLIFAVVGMRHKIRNKNKKNIKNYIEIFIDADLKKIIKFKKKIIYKTNNKKNIVGFGIKPELPLKPDIIIKNNFKKSIKDMTDELFFKITKLIKR